MTLQSESKYEIVICCLLSQIIHKNSKLNYEAQIDFAKGYMT